MRERFWRAAGVAAIVFGIVVGVAAQEPATTPPATTPSATTPSATAPPSTPQSETTPSTAPPSRATSSTDKVTMTGCLERADQASAGGATGTTGTTGIAGTATATAGAGGFILAKAAMAGKASTETGAPSSTEAAGASSSTYRLVGDDSALTSHVGEKVEIAGTIEPAAAPLPSPREATTAAAPAARMLMVSSVKTIAANCKD